MIISVAVLLAIAAVVFVLFVRESDVPAPIPVSPVQHLNDRKQAIYDNLRDLQFEYRLGKLSDEDYQSTKQALQKELAVVLSETEAIVARLGLGTVSSSSKGVTALKKGAGSKPPVPATPAGGTECQACGAKFPQPLKFCGECGKAIA